LLEGIIYAEFLSESLSVGSFAILLVSGKELRGERSLDQNSIPNVLNALNESITLHQSIHLKIMFNPPRKLENLSEIFQALCDAVMDLNFQPLVGNVPEDLLECAHLIVLADASIVRECATVAEQLSTVAPHERVSLVLAHHQK
jgi:hypothetical protein